MSLPSSKLDSLPVITASRRRFLAQAAALVGAGALVPSQALGQKSTKAPQKKFEWRLVTIDNRDYVRMKDVKEFYRFERYERSGPQLWLRSEGLWVKVREDSDDLFINDIKFCMSLPTQQRDGDILISRMDLAKLVEPVLRPRQIANPIVFDTVVLDAGHGGEDPGTKGRQGWEKDYTLDMCQRLQKILLTKGLKVKLTRDKDTTIKDKGARTDVANAIPNSIFVSIHFNSGHHSAAGIETYALSPHGAASTDHTSRATDLYEHDGNDRDSENIALATAVHAMVLYKVKCLDRGIRRARWTVLTGLQRAGILFEGGFITNTAESAQVNLPEYRQGMAEAMADGILRYREVLVNRSRNRR
jgi:N-acetylmuramoyl-L-alanine amidase